MNTLLKRGALLLIVIIIFTGLLLNNSYKNSKADRITTNEEYLEQLKNASAGKNLPGQIAQTPPVQKDKGPIETMLESIIHFFYHQ